MLEFLTGNVEFNIYTHAYVQVTSSSSFHVFLVSFNFVFPKVKYYPTTD